MPNYSNKQRGRHTVVGSLSREWKLKLDSVLLPGQTVHSFVTIAVTNAVHEHLVGKHFEVSKIELEELRRERDYLRGVITEAAKKAGII